MEKQPSPPIENTGDYHGKIRHSLCSPALKQYISDHIRGLQAFDGTNPPVIPYLSAWQEKEQNMWYEFAGRRFCELMNCSPSQVAAAFREGIIERRAYTYRTAPDGTVATQTLGPSELTLSRSGLRREGEKKGLIEAVYKVKCPDGRIVWLKDQATVKAFEKDNIHISAGCLTLITKEMEAEEELLSTQKKLREKALALKKAQKIQKKNTQELSRAVEALETARKEAEEANRAKSEFLAVISHEIRNPMNGIIGTCDLIMDDDLSLQQNEYLGIIKSSAISLLGLINDILDFSKIEAGKMEFLETPFDIREMIEDVSDIFLELMSKKRLELVVDIHPDVPARVVSDPMRLRQILINLTSNALKFTEKGEIIIGVEPCDTTDAHMDLKFYVRDTGIGIAPEHLSGLFDSFTQIQQPINREYGGTGLGLAICRRIVEMMNGTIWVKSRPEKGSTFYFKAPCQCVAPPPKARPHIPREFRQETALIAINNDAVQKVLRQMLASWGFQVTTASSAIEAAWKISQQPVPSFFKPIIVDMGLEDLEDDTVMAALKEAAVFPQFMAISNMGRPEETRRAMALGIASPMTKPIKQSLLLYTIKQRLGYPVGTDVEKKKTIPPGQRFTNTRILFVEDNTINLKVGTEMLRMAGVEVDTARNGIEAVEKVRQGRYDALLIDIQMPHLDGIEASRIIREEISCRNLPIIAMSAHAKSMKWQECLSAGIDDYIVKPFSRNALFTVLKKQLHKDDNGDLNHTIESTAPSAPEPGLPGLDIAQGLERLGGSRQIYGEVLSDFCQTHAEFHRQMAQLLAEEDFKGAATLAHSIKGAAGNISAGMLFETTKALEAACWQKNENEIHALLPGARKAFSQVCDSARRFLDGLEDASSGKAFSPDAPAIETAAALKPRLQALMESLKSFDPVQSEALVAEIQPRMARQHGTAMDRLARHVKDYQFDAALEILEPLLAPGPKESDPETAGPARTFPTENRP